MTEKITIDALTEKSVSIATQKILIENGVEHKIGEIHRKGYVNSERGRQALIAELAEPYLSAVLAVWGDTPTVEEMVIDDYYMPPNN